MKKLVFLDDYRNPNVLLEDGSSWLVFSPIEQPFEVIWLKSYNEFIEYISLNGLPDAVCFDHDLADNHYQPDKYYNETHPEFEKLDYNDWAKSQDFEEKTGYDCAKWLVEYCMDKSLKLPLYNIQSANPVGKANIDGILKSFIKHAQV